MIFPLSQMPASELTLIVQAGADPRWAAPVVRQVVRALDPRMPTLQMLTLEEHVRYGSYESRIAAILVSSLSLAGLTLALIGVYGAMSAAVASRAREIGVRLALGATRIDILRHVLWRALMLAGCGVGLGVLLSLAAGRLLAGSLYGITASDPATFVAVGTGLIVLSMLASWEPCRRAMGVDPIASLRAE
jgi:ABC-type antimicrobial peptide transport system permease subunit